MVERRMSEWPGRSTGSSASSTARMSRRSISMCDSAGVPRVSTMWSAPAASATRSESVSPTRSRTSCAPVSAKGMVPARTASRRSGSLSMPITRSPRSANERARGSPTRPSPMMETSALIALETLAAARAPPGVPTVLAGEAGHETRVVARVAPPEPPRLTGEPVGPLEPRGLHPWRRLADQAGVEVERGAHPGEHRRLEVAPHLGHPLLLLGLADADPDHVRARAVDVLGHPAPLVG